MKTLEKRDYSLYGIVYPNDMRILGKKLGNILPAIKEIYSTTNPHQVIRIEFDFTCITKGDVYRILVEATKLPYGIRYSQRKLAKLLAKFTNLADNPDYEKRVNTIRQGFKRYQKRNKILTIS